MLVVEILNRQIDFEIEEETEEEFVTKVIIAGRLYRFYAHQSSLSTSAKDWECSFAEYRADGSAHVDKTGHGNELEVFSFVRQSILMFLEKYKPNRIYFESSKGDGNRSKLYAKMLNRFKVPNYEFFINDFNDSDLFTLKRKE